MSALPKFDVLDEVLKTRNVSNAKQEYVTLCETNPQTLDLIRSRVELLLRTQALQLGKNPQVKSNDLQQFLDFVVLMAREELCAKPLTVTVIQDVFDVSSKRKCEELFAVVENSIASIWKTPFFFDSCKNSVLRMCNDLLKRLSQTVDTTFCGRILILLAKALPLNERSGLNLMSQVNSNNVTTYDQDVEMKEEEEIKKEDDDVEMEIGEILEHKDLNIDYELYVKFWKLQDFFVTPTQVYAEDKWLLFENNLADVFTVFSTNKLERPRDEDGSKMKLKPEQNGLNGVNGTDQLNGKHSEDEEGFSAKYLTNQRLFHLQIADSQFRRYFLTQCLIFINYLSNPNIKSRDPTLLLTATQEKTLENWSDRCYQLLKETYPHGSHFADSLKKILKTDKVWSNWKNEGCPDLVAQLVPDDKLITFPRKQPDDYNPQVVDLGNPELTRLWNIDTNNLNSCKSESRRFDSVLESILDDTLDEIDPAQQVEEQYMKVNDEKYQWMCSRYLIYNNYQHFTKAASSLQTESPKKGEPISTATHLKFALLTAAKEMDQYKEKATEIEVRLIAEQKKAMEKAAERARLEAEARAAAIEAKAVADAKKAADVKAGKLKVKASESNGKGDAKSGDTKTKSGKEDRKEDRLELKEKIKASKEDKPDSKSAKEDKSDIKSSSKSSTDAKPINKSRSSIEEPPKTPSKSRIITSSSVDKSTPDSRTDFKSSTKTKISIDVKSGADAKSAESKSTKTKISAPSIGSKSASDVKPVSKSRTMVEEILKSVGEIKKTEKKTRISVEETKDEPARKKHKQEKKEKSDEKANKKDREREKERQHREKRHKADGSERGRSHSKTRVGEEKERARSHSRHSNAEKRRSHSRGNKK